MIITWWLALIFAGAFTAMCWRRWDLALPFVIFALPAYGVRFNIAGYPSTLLEVMIIITAVVWVARSWRQGQWPIVTLNAVWLTLIGFLAIAATVAWYFSSQPVAAAGIWKAYFIEPLLFFIILASNIRSRSQLYKIVSAMSITVIIIGLVAIVQQITGWGIPNPYWQAVETRRVVSIFSYPNAIGLYVAPIVVIVWGFLLAAWSEVRRTRRWLWSGAIMLGLLAMVFAQSEAALAASIIVMFAVALHHRRWRKPALAAGLLAAVVVLSLAPLRQMVIEKASLLDYSGRIRRTMWQETWAMLQDHPIVGAGLSGYQSAIVPYHAPHFEIFLYPHTWVFTWWSELGLLGLVVTTLLIIYFYYFAGRSYVRVPDDPVVRGLIVAVMAGMATLLLHGLVDVPYFKNDLAVLFWVIVAMIIALRHEVSEEVSRL